MTGRAFITIDVAHPPMRTEEAELELDRLLREPGLRGLKIIHGYGSGGTGGALKELVQGWTHRRRNRIRAVVDGNDCRLTNPTIEAMIKELKIEDPDLLRPNAGITVVWIR